MVKRAKSNGHDDRAWTPTELVNRHFGATPPMPIAHDEAQPRRINLVVDNINAPQLFGGVGTAIILGALLAERTQRELRVVTRMAEAHPQNVARVLSAASVESRAPVSFAYAPDFRADEGPQRTLCAHRDDLFVTTSWWTTRATLGSIDASRIVYLLQEDERMFYPLGDEHLRCAELLAETQLTYVVNTQLLFDHLVGSGLPHLRSAGMWFEPSFPRELFHDTRSESAAAPYRFLYYARPNNMRNLFYRGIEAIEQAMASGVLDPKEWELHFAGKDIPTLALPGGVRPRVYENLSWHAYAAMVRKMDLGLCLMYTPHPSYPPLDLAAAGAVAVTNRFGDKTDLSSYCGNIVCTDVALPSLVEGIARGAVLARDRAQRQANHRAARIGRDWRISFAAVVDSLASRLST
jgi:hypothetical protein